MFVLKLNGSPVYFTYHLLFNVVAVIMCLCLNLLDMAELVPLRARFPFSYGSEQGDVTV